MNNDTIQTATGPTVRERLATACATLKNLQREIGAAEKKELSDAEFANRFLPISAATWSRLQAPEKYGAKLDSVTLKLEDAADNIRQRIDNLRRNTEAASGFIKTRFALAVLGAWQRAQDDADTRIVVALGPTGSGKSEIGRFLATKHDAVCVEGRESWRHSYKAFCLDVTAAARAPLSSRKCDEYRAETAMLAALGPRPGILYIDEANTLGPFSANGIKLIANQTRHIVVIAAIPEMWDTFCARATNEVRQVLNRCQAVIRFDRVADSDARALLAGCGLSEADMAAAAKATAKAANDAGAYKLVKRVGALLRETEAPTLADVDKAVALARSALDEVRGK